jgi:hypothetical protein
LAILRGSKGVAGADETGIDSDAGADDDGKIRDVGVIIRLSPSPLTHIKKEEMNDYHHHHHSCAVWR